MNLRNRIATWVGGTEHRASYTDAAIQSILASATGSSSTNDPRLTGAAQTAAGLVGRSLSVAVVQPDILALALTARVLNDIGQALVLDGEAVYRIDVMGGRLILERCSDFDPYNAGEGVRYKLTVPGATSTRSYDVAATDVFHPRINMSKSEPYKGRSPIILAGYTGRMLANTERSLRDETGAPVGRVLPAPLENIKTGDLDQLKADLGSLEGRTALVESMSRNWGDGRSGSPNADWRSQRIGADPPDAIVNLRDAAHNAVLGAAGVPPSIFAAGANANAAREGLRQFAHATLEPLADQIVVEVRDKLFADATLDLRRLMASDIQAKARSFKSLVDGGMPLDQAAAASGVLMDEGA